MVDSINCINSKLEISDLFRTNKNINYSKINDGNDLTILWTDFENENINNKHIFSFVFVFVFESILSLFSFLVLLKNV